MQQNDGKVSPIKVCFDRCEEQLFSKKQNYGSLLVSTVGPLFATSTAKIIIRYELTTYGMELFFHIYLEGSSALRHNGAEVINSNIQMYLFLFDMGKILLCARILLGW